MWESWHLTVDTDCNFLRELFYPNLPCLLIRRRMFFDLDEGSIQIQNPKLNVIMISQVRRLRSVFSRVELPFFAFCLSLPSLHQIRLASTFPFLASNRSIDREANIQIWVLPIHPRHLLLIDQSNFWIEHILQCREPQHQAEAEIIIHPRLFLRSSPIYPQTLPIQ